MPTGVPPISAHHSDEFAGRFAPRHQISRRMAAAIAALFQVIFHVDRAVGGAPDLRVLVHLRSPALFTGPMLRRGATGRLKTALFFPSGNLEILRSL